MDTDTRTTKPWVAVLPFAVTTLGIIALFAFCFLTFTLPALLNQDTRKPVEAPVAVEPSQTTGSIVPGVYVSSDGGAAYCFKDGVFLGAVADPVACERAFFVWDSWSSASGAAVEGGSLGMWSYHLPSAYWNGDVQGWDCYFQGEYNLTATLDDCLVFSKGVSAVGFQDAVNFVLLLPTTLGLEPEGFPCAVGAFSVGFSRTDDGCAAVYERELTVVPYRV